MVVRPENPFSLKNNNARKKENVKRTVSFLSFRNSADTAQFLRGYTNVELLKDVQPEDIEDITEGIYDAV